ncbi:AsmA family protein [Ectothiorhodospira lacustris]|uniref:AsmA family protein n=1 Tax=Ectothiorhodospira lacustris TaxID=2899127 RepID=UPI001EE7ED1E|nr:AsmA family protein [Ectothiorhodospira lacustris]MCG5501110.1 AsmA family protein [Ectothiorhodospira lacustris]
MKWIKRALMAVALVLVLFVALLIFLLATFDPNAYKDRISTAVQEQTGRELTISGDIGLSIFPRLALALGETTLANGEGFPDDHFARIREVDVAVAMLPLLRRELQVERVRLEGLDLNLARDARGRSNWDDLLKDVDAPEVSAETPPSESDALPSALRGLDIAGIEVIDARVRWRDAQAGTDLVVDPFNLTLGRLRLGQETPLELTFQTRLGEPALTAVTDLSALLYLDVANQRYGLRRLTATLDARGETLPAPILARLEGDLWADLRNDTATLERLTVTAFDTQLTGLMKVESLTDEPRVHGELRSGRINPRQLMQALGMEEPETANPDVLKNAALDLGFVMQGERLDLSQLMVTLDETTLTGRATVSGFATPAINLSLQVDRINLDHYLPPAEDRPAPGAGQVPAPRDGWPEETIDLPLALLRPLNLSGDLGIGRLVVGNLHLSDVVLELRARDGQVELRPFRAALYDGRVEGALGLDARGEIPRFQARSNLQGVRMGNLLQDLTGEAPMVTGTANLRLDLNSRGDSVKALIAGLNGDGDLRFADGAVKGINVAQIIRDAEGRLRGRAVEPADEPVQTDFTELTGSFRINNGVVDNQDLQASSPLLRVRGRGTVDLNRERLDYRLDTGLVATLEGQGGRSLDDLRNVNLPITIRGTFSEPRFGLDLAGVVSGRLDQERERLEQQVQERVEEKVQPLIDQQRDRVQQEADRIRDQLGDRLLDRLR